MATSHEIIDAFSGRSTFQLRLAIALDSIEQANNRSRYDASLRINNTTGTTATWALGQFAYAISINGVSYGGTTPGNVFDFRDGDSYHNIKLFTTDWIVHDPDGNKTISMSCSLNNASIFGSASKSGSMVANRIPKAPAAPGAPSFSGLNPKGFTAAWTASPNNMGSAITGYRLRVAPGLDPQVGFTDYAVGPSTLSKLVDSLSPGTEYSAVVYAQNAVGYSLPSPVASVRTLSGMYVGLSGSYPAAEVYVGKDGTFQLAELLVGSGGSYVPAG